MTRCVLYVDAAGQLTGFACKGHSGYAEAGEDIVCAGVSALVLTCDHALAKLVGLKLTERQQDGFAEVILPREMTEEQRHDAQLLLEALHIGLENIARDYPRHVHLMIRKVK